MRGWTCKRGRIKVRKGDEQRGMGEEVMETEDKGKNSEYERRQEKWTRGY